MSALTDYADAEWRKRKAKEDIVAAQRDLDAAEIELLGEWTETGQQNATINGLTIGVRRDLYAAARRDEEANSQATDEEKQALYDALQAYGAGDLVKPNVNASSLAAWVREIIAEKEEEYEDPNDALPEELRAVLKVSVKMGLRATKSS